MSYEIQYHVWIQWKGKYECSGTVIHNRYILTTANCLIQSVPNAEYKTKLKLKKNLYGFDAYEVAIPLSEERAKSHEGLELFVSGYGQITVKNAFIDYDQHKFYMEILSMTRCKKLFPDVDLSGKFCAIPALGYKSCMSDIGSPATVNKMHLIGIYIGFKEVTDCLKHYAELFIDVTSYSDFIRSAILNSTDRL
ncbi:thrombin-like enzyme KN-BJ 2 [Phymastichus coffea]|uniref:thrombin-like enzyme KN-BJ 2 n=1 Tax=Phymastichus coffea TaxID=108790 RepID=UPI00273B8CE9|nr:thrombin-like enzyme KN-BJ 2 [Phymastichus coffea]